MTYSEGKVDGARFSVEELEAMPTLEQGQADDLKIATPERKVWLSRCGVEDGEPCDNKVTIEELVDGRWVEVGWYEAERQHDPACTGCEHDCPHKRTSPEPIGSPYCQVCQDHADAVEAGHPIGCATCGSTDLWAWYSDPTRQTINAWVEGDEVRYDYTGVTKSADDAGPDESYTCGGCGATAETIEELVGRPRPPLLGRSLSEWEALTMLIGDHDDPDAPFPSGADFIEAVVGHFGFTRESYVRFIEQRDANARLLSGDAD